MIMVYNLFLIPFLVSFAIAALLLILFILANRKKSFDDGRISSRHIHHRGISRFGGAALILSFAAALLLNKMLVITFPLAGVLLASGAILIFGIADDIRQISWKIQIFFQTAIVLFVYSFGVQLQYMTNPLGGIFLFNDFFGQAAGLAVVLVWTVLLMNSMNWIDGVDGVSSGIAFIGGLTIFILSLRPEVNQPPISIIAAALIGGTLALVFFNFHPAKILAGTSGSMFMGFILAILAIFAGAKIATTLLVMAVPIIDAFWVIGERIRSKSSIFSADKRHLHFRLMELGWSPKMICLFYWGITALIAILALSTGAIGKTITFVLFGIIMVGMIVLIKNKVSHKIQ
jgi:UDP-GlcNAc:undecaprenyl-phosphate/decaprenyl-phosphate GlcNAc-1-phosphate transferase